MLKSLNDYSSATTEVAHTGGISRNPKIREGFVFSSQLKEELEREVGQVDYDLSFEGKPSQLIMSEIFGGMGCIMVKTADAQFNQEMLTRAKPGERKFDVSAAAPKYIGFELPLPSVKECVFLPGSNLLERGVVSDEVINFLSKNGCWIKPHPLTTRSDLYHLKKQFAGRLLSTHDNAIRIIDKCETVYVTTSSELGLYAKLKGKRVRVLDKTSLQHNYTHFYNCLDRLPVLVTTSESGIFKPEEPLESQVSAWLTNYRRVA